MEDFGMNIRCEQDHTQLPEAKHPRFGLTGFTVTTDDEEKNILNKVVIDIICYKCRPDLKKD